MAKDFINPCHSEKSNRNDEKNSSHLRLICSESHDLSHKILNNEKIRDLRPNFLRFQDDKKKCAFTLAEVLITLGISGVVATLTIPTLISNNNKRIVETRLAKFYSTMNQAVELSEVYNGPKEKWDAMGHGPTINEDGSKDYTKPLAMPWVEKYLLPYIKTTKVTSQQGGQGKVILEFADGSLALISSNATLFYPKATDYYNSGIVDDFVGTDCGKKWFQFFFHPQHESNGSYKYHIDKGFEPYMFAWNGTEEHLKTDSNFGCRAGNNNPAYCTQLIRMNGWKIPDDYPFKF